MKVDGAKLAAARERVFNSQDELAESISMNPVIVMRLETADRTEIRDNLGQLVRWPEWLLRTLLYPGVSYLDVMVLYLFQQ